MFDAEYFKELLNETTNLLASKPETNKSHADEMEMKIESNVAALKHLARKITDEDLKKNTLRRIDLLCLEPEEFEMNVFQKRGETVDVKKNDDNSDRIEREILKYSKNLHNKARKLLENLELDSKILGEVSDKMSRNLAGTSATLKALKESGHHISAFKILVMSLIIFIAMYFVIRFT